MQEATDLTEKVLNILRDSQCTTAVASVMLGAVTGQIVLAYSQIADVPAGDVAEGLLRQIAMGIEVAAKGSR